MANTRTVSIVVCGAVLGIIVGAGAVAAVVQSGLSAAVSRTSNYYAVTPRGDAVVRSQATKNYMFHGAPLPYHYTRRRIEEKNPVIRTEQDESAFPTLKEQTQQSSSSPKPAVSSSPCEVAKATAEKIRATYNRYIPVTMKNTEIRSQMDATFSDAINDYCASAASAADIPSGGTHSAAATVDNNCAQYPKQTIRYTQCVIYQQKGVTYP